MNGHFTILKPGLFTCLQDLGRIQGRDWGLPAGGAMDQLAASRANLLFDNPLNTPVVEITGLGPTFQTTHHCQLSITGGTPKIFINKQSVTFSNLISLQAADEIQFGAIENGYRTYLGIKNGFITNTYFGSVSRVAGWHESLRLDRGDKIKFNTSINKVFLNARVKLNRKKSEHEKITCYRGPEWDILTSDQQQYIFNKDFTIQPTATRMAFPLSPVVTILQHQHSLLTVPVVPGVVQLTPAGQLIVLMRDAQTTGGYPRILTLNQEGINQISQLKIGEKFKIEMKKHIN